MLRLHDKTLQLLDKRPRDLTLKTISEQTGISYWWLTHFSKRRNNEPGVNQVEKLYTFLSGRDLRL